MAVKVQYNPSTGKVSYNPATGKVQVVVPAPCDNCTDTPSTIQVTISNMAIEVGCVNGVGFYSDVFDINQSFILTQTVADPCIWERLLTSEDGVEGKLVVWSISSTCTGTITDTFNLSEILLRVDNTGVNPVFTLRCIDGVHTPAWLGAGSWTSLECVSGEDTSSNNTDGIFYYAPFQTFSVVVEEL